MYAPENPPQTEDVNDALQWMFTELQRLSEALSETNALELRTTYQEPIRPREGLIVQADGTEWNPGEGAGTYAYRNGAWELLSRALAAATNLVDVKVTVFTGDGTFTPQANSKATLWLLQAPGGGGGGADADADTSNYAGGGEGGGFVIKLFTAAEMGASAAVTVPTGGAGGANTGGNGTDGGDVVVNPAGTGATITALGGDGGDGSATLSPTGSYTGLSGDAESGGTNGDVNIAGGRSPYTSVGGDSVLGFGGSFAAVDNVNFGATSNAGINGKGYGGGGGGAIVHTNTTGQAGGNGAPGIAICIEFIGNS